MLLSVHNTHWLKHTWKSGATVPKGRSYDSLTTMALTFLRDAGGRSETEAHPSVPSNRHLSIQESYLAALSADTQLFTLVWP